MLYYHHNYACYMCDQQCDQQWRQYMHGDVIAPTNCSTGYANVTIPHRLCIHAHMTSVLVYIHAPTHGVHLSSWLHAVRYMMVDAVCNTVYHSPLWYIPMMIYY